jgi:hypothetical protein
MSNVSENQGSMTAQTAAANAIRSADELLRRQTQRESDLVRPYTRDGSHVTVGQPQPLSADFEPSIPSR